MDWDCIVMKLLMIQSQPDLNHRQSCFSFSFHSLAVTVMHHFPRCSHNALGLALVQSQKRVWLFCKLAHVSISAVLYYIAVKCWCEFSTNFQRLQALLSTLNQTGNKITALSKCGSHISCLIVNCIPLQDIKSCVWQLPVEYSLELTKSSIKSAVYITRYGRVFCAKKNTDS